MGNDIKRQFTSFWLRKAEEQTGFIVVAIAVMTLYFMFLWGVEISESAQRLRVMVFAFSAFMLFIYEMMNVRNLSYISLAFGSTRKNALILHQAAVLLEAVQLCIVAMLVNTVINYLSGNAVSIARNTVVYLAVYIAAIGLGEIAAIVTIKFGQVGMGIVGGVSGGCFGGFIGFAGSGAADGNNFLGWLFVGNNIVIAAVCLGVVLYTAGVLVQKKHLVHAEIKIS
jgi:hypothetical protein